MRHLPNLTREQYETFNARYCDLSLAYTNGRIEFAEFVRSVNALETEASEVAARNVRIRTVFTAPGIAQRIDAAAALTEADWKAIASTPITARQIEEVAEQ